MNVIATPFPCVRRRPAMLSNRGCCHSADELEAVLRTPDARLGWSQFAAIFPISNCSATYDEQLYFVPVAFAHMAAEAMDGREYASGFVEFFERNAALLDDDGLREATEHAFLALIDNWTATFEVVHYDAAASAKKGWSIEYLDAVERSTAVMEILALLLERPTLEHVGETAVRRLLSPGSPDPGAAWFLEIAREQYDGWVHLPSGVAATRVRDLLTNPALLTEQFERIRHSIVGSEQSPTYWHDVLFTLDL